MRLAAPSWLAGGSSVASGNASQERFRAELERRPDHISQGPRLRTTSENVAPHAGRGHLRRRVLSFGSDRHAHASSGSGSPAFHAFGDLEERRPLTRMSVDTQEDLSPLRLAQPAKRRRRKLSKSRPPMVSVSNVQADSDTGEGEDLTGTNSGGRHDGNQKAVEAHVSAITPFARRIQRARASRDDKRVSRSVAVLLEALQPSTPAAHDGAPVPNPEDGAQVSGSVPANDLRHLRSQLSKPHEARKIFVALKERSPGHFGAPPAASPRLESIQEEEGVTVPPPPTHQWRATKAVCLDKPDATTLASPRSPPTIDSAGAPSDACSQSVLSMSSLRVLDLIPTPGTALGMAGQMTGMFDAVADEVGNAVRRSGVHAAMDGAVVPVDRMSTWLYWWGFEIALPPPSVAYLSSVHSVGAALIQLIGALVTVGGAPELAPFVKLIGSYGDLEWKAILTQNHGRGVVLAATWILPAALVPRPWDLTIASIS